MKRRLPRLTVTQALLFGTLTVGTLDMLCALVVAGLRGATPILVLQSIASGILGRAAYGGGIQTAILGLGLHFFIALVVVAVCLVASRRFVGVVRRPILSGAVYGLLVYAVMHVIVIPLSAAMLGPRTPSSIFIGLLIHVIAVGIPSVLFARAARQSPEE